MTESERRDEVFEEIREKDRAVLECIEEGDDDVQYITNGTTLSNSEVNYCFKRLEDKGLIEVEKVDGMVERVVDGTRQVFEAPKQAELTDLGREFLDVSADTGSERYRDLSYEELVMYVRDLESDLQDLEQRFNLFRRQVQNRLSDEN